MPRKTFDETQHLEDQWTEFEVSVAHLIETLEHGQKFTMWPAEKRRAWHIAAARREETLVIDLEVTKKGALTTAQQAILLDLGWGSVSAGGGVRAFRVMWEPAAPEEAIDPTERDRRPWWQFWSLEPEPPYISDDDRWEAAGLLVATLKEPLALLSVDDVEVSQPFPSP